MLSHPVEARRTGSDNLVPNRYWLNSCFTVRHKGQNPPDCFACSIQTPRRKPHVSLSSASGVATLGLSFLRSAGHVTAGLNELSRWGLTKRWSAPHCGTLRMHTAYLWKEPRWGQVVVASGCWNATFRVMLVIGLDYNMAARVYHEKLEGNEYNV